MSMVNNAGDLEEKESSRLLSLLLLLYYVCDTAYLFWQGRIISSHWNYWQIILKKKKKNCISLESSFNYKLIIINYNFKEAREPPCSCFLETMNKEVTLVRGFKKWNLKQCFLRWQKLSLKQFRHNLPRDKERA